MNNSLRCTSNKDSDAEALNADRTHKVFFGIRIWVRGVFSKQALTFSTRYCDCRIKRRLGS